VAESSTSKCKIRESVGVLETSKRSNISAASINEKRLVRKR
jgi:hypothetical protein